MTAAMSSRSFYHLLKQKLWAAERKRLAIIRDQGLSSVVDAIRTNDEVCQISEMGVVRKSSTKFVAVRKSFFFFREFSIWAWVFVCGSIQSKKQTNKTTSVDQCKDTLSMTWRMARKANSTRVEYVEERACCEIPLFLSRTNRVVSKLFWFGLSSLADMKFLGRLFNWLYN